MKETVIKIDPGPHVNCDMCNEEYMDSDEKGGFLFLSNAVCPKCEPEFEKKVKKYNEEKYIRARPKDGESFRDFVYRIRKEHGDDQINSYDDR
jgi:hypothetical protein